MASRLSRMCVSRSSMAVMYILEIMPIEQTDCVITPQAAPGPVTRIHISAQTMDGMVRIIRIRMRTMYATAFGMILNEARNAKGMARIAPKIVPSTAMAMVCSSRYGTSESPVPNNRFVSGWNTPWRTPLATSVPVAVRPVKWMSSADQPTSSVTASTITRYKIHLRGRFSYISSVVSFRSSDCSSMAILSFFSILQPPFSSASCEGIR